MTIALDQPELNSLAELCARRFGNAATRSRFAVAAGIELDATDPGDERRAWSQLLEHAQAQGRVARLVDVMARAAPNDEILAEVANVFRPSVRPRLAGGFIWAGALAALLVAGAGAWALWPAATPIPNPPELAPPAPMAAAAPAAPEVGPVAEAPPAPIPAEPVAVARERPTAARGAATTCGATEGVAGYWYAGSASPGAQGATIVLPAAARVRAEYPNRQNGHNAQSTLRCVLPAGTRVTLAEAPVHVAGDKWWVPYVVGSAP